MKCWLCTEDHPEVLEEGINLCNRCWELKSRIETKTGLRIAIKIIEFLGYRVIPECLA